MAANATIAWLTGLAGAGKTSIAVRVRELLQREGLRVLVLDGDAIRSRWHNSLGFSPEDIRENNRRIVDLCHQSLEHYDVILVPVIAPFRDSRQYAREMLGRALVEVYVKASIDEVIRRDPKGLYRQALKGSLAGVIGLSPEVPYEVPEHPDLTLDTEAMDPESCARRLAEALIVRSSAAGSR